MPEAELDWHDIRLCTQRTLPASARQFDLAQAANPSNIPHVAAGLERIRAVGTITKKWAPGRVLPVPTPM